MVHGARQPDSPHPPCWRFHPAAVSGGRGAGEGAGQHERAAAPQALRLHPLSPGGAGGAGA